MMSEKSIASPDLSSCSGDEWNLLGEGNANVVFSYVGTDPELVRYGRENEHSTSSFFYLLSFFLGLNHFLYQKEQIGLVLRLRKTKAKAQSALDEAVDAMVWAPLNDEGSPPSSSSAADRDANFARKIASPLLGEEYLLLPSVVAVHVRLRLSLESQLAAKGRGSSSSRKKRKDPGDEGLSPLISLEERGALLRNATLWENEEPGSKSVSSSLCVELKPKCGLPHGTGRRTKVRLKQQQQQQQRRRRQRQQAISSHKSTYCPSDLFSGEAARRKKALAALISDALARSFSHSAPRAAHFRLFDENGEPLEGTQKAERAIEELLGSGCGGGCGCGSGSKKKGVRRSPPSSTFRLLVGALDSVLSFEPLLPRLLDAQSCPECPTAAVAAEHLSVLREVAAAKKTSSSSSVAAAAVVSAAASSLRSYLTATSARDLSVMILLRRGGGEETCEKEKGGKPFLQRDAAAVGGAVELLSSSSSLSSPSSPSSSFSHQTLRYRIALCDLDAKPSSKAELHAAADEKLPRSGARRQGEKKK